MNLKYISDETLIAQLKKLVAEERRILTEILQHLSEVDNRKLHLREGYPSLFEYAVKALGYTESQSYRRISAMRLLRELPEMESSVAKGTINLTHLTQAREYFKQMEKEATPVTHLEKLTLLESLQGKTSRETERVFAVLSPEIEYSEKIRAVSGEQTQITFIASSELLKKLNRFKDLDSHVQLNPTFEKLFGRLVDLALKQKEPKTDLKTKQENWEEKREDKPTHFSGSDPSHLSAPKKSRYIPSQIKRVVFASDQGSCSYKNLATGKRCGSTFQLQFDHRVPFAKGGDHSPHNLRLLCKAHNLWCAKIVFGKKMFEKKVYAKIVF